MYNVMLVCCFFFHIRLRGGMPMCQYCSLCFVAYSWPYPTTSAAKAAIQPSCGLYLEFYSVSNALLIKLMILFFH